MRIKELLSDEKERFFWADGAGLLTLNDRWMSRSFWMNYCMMFFFASIYQYISSPNFKWPTISVGETSGYFRIFLPSPEFNQFRLHLNTRFDNS